MKANIFLTVRTLGGSAVFSLIHRGWMNFIGASCNASAKQFTYQLQTLNISVPTGEPALVILKTSQHPEKGGGFTDNLSLIPITWDDRKMIVDLEQPFVPSYDKLLQVTEELDLAVTTAGQRFTTCDPSHITSEVHEDKRVRFLDSGCRILNDANLLCRFLVGQATLEDLEAAATQDVRSQTERELGQAKVEIERVSRDAVCATQHYEKSLFRIASLEQDLLQARADSEQLSLKLVKAEEQIGALQLALGDASTKSKLLQIDLTACRRESANTTKELQECRARLSVLLLDKAKIFDILYKGEGTLFGSLPWVKIRKLYSLVESIYKRDGVW